MPSTTVTVPDAPTLAVAVMDIEASGFGRGSYPIEIGFVTATGSAACTLVRPEPDWTHWDPAAEGVHGITRDTAVRHGRRAEDVARWLNQELAGQVVYCDGWAHDYTWLGVLYEAAGLQPRFRLEHILRLLDVDQARRLGPVRQAVWSKAPDTRHRASSDARLLQRALTEVLVPA
ncbi:MAG TPA: hypothetical protein VIW70_07190 [Rubrivivax sp.]